MLSLEKLDKKIHDRHSFDCGVKELNLYLKQQARQESNDGYAVVYVIVDKKLTPNQICGYFTLNSFFLLKKDPSGLFDIKERSYPQIPAILIGRLAKNINQDKLKGSELLATALIQAKRISSELGAVFVVAHAKNEHAAEFYLRYGFKKIPSKKNEYVFPINLIEQ